MGQASQTGFDTTHYNRHIGIHFTAFLRINSDRAIWTFAALVSGGIGIIMTQTTVSRIAIDHGIHIASGNTKVQVGLAQLTKAISVAPIWLRQNAYPKALRL